MSKAFNTQVNNYHKNTELLSTLFLFSGFCHTIKSQEIPLEYGKPYGIAAILYLDDFGYINMYHYKMNIHKTFAAGAALFVHPPNTLPLLGDAVTLSPGHHASVRVR